MRPTNATDVLGARLATQRLSGPAAADPVQVVRELLCVQSQDALLAQAMIALRCAAADSEVRAAIGRGEIVRTHVLRPTWHYLAAEDLRWLLALTSPKVESGMAARHRQLSIDEAGIARALEVVAARLRGRSFCNRKQLGSALAEVGQVRSDDPLFGQQVGHLMMIAELRGLICSAPTTAVEHHYALVDEVIAPTPPRERDQAVRELVGRFVAGHGPVALSDLTRWVKVTLVEARTALSELGEQVARIELDGAELWYCPATQRPPERDQDAWLLSTFDEAFLSYRVLPWPRSSQHPAGDNPYRFAEAGGGVVIHRLQDVGSWKRTMVKGRAELTFTVDHTLPRHARGAIERAADQLRSAIAQS